MKITKTTDCDITTYFYDGVKKYEHYKAPNGLENWSEYKDGEEIHHKNSEGYESWSNKNWIEGDIRPFEFGNKTNMKTNEKEKQLFDMIYQWGRTGLKTDENCNAFQELLSEIIETKYEQELKIADDRWKRAEELNQQTL